MRIGIGKLSKLTDCNIETIRYYERIGLLAAPARTEGGHRQYDEMQVKRLVFVRRSRELGFALDEIRNLLTMVDRGDVTCGEVRDVASGHLGNVRAKIADLKRMERILSDTVERCVGGKTPDCPILDALNEQPP